MHRVHAIQYEDTPEFFIRFHRFAMCPFKGMDDVTGEEYFQVGSLRCCMQVVGGEPIVRLKDVNTGVTLSAGAHIQRTLTNGYTWCSKPNFHPALNTEVTEEWDLSSTGRWRWFGGECAPTGVQVLVRYDGTPSTHVATLMELYNNGHGGAYSWCESLGDEHRAVATSPNDLWMPPPAGPDAWRITGVGSGEV